VSVNGKVVCNAAYGTTEPGGHVPMTVDHLLPWSSAVKPITALAMAVQVERGTMCWDDPVVKHIPEFGKPSVTLAHCLLHTAGFPFASAVYPPDGFESAQHYWEAELKASCDDTLEWVPGERCMYHGMGAWHVVAEAVRRVAGAESYADHLAQTVFAPLGMGRSHCGMPKEAFDKYTEQDVLADLYMMPSESPVGCLDGRMLEHCQPSGGGIGPASELARPFESLLEGAATRLVGEPAAQALIAKRRVGMVDELQGGVFDWGYVGAIDVALMGRHCSPGAFGHGGSQQSNVFADPAHGLVVAMLFNGKPGPTKHYERLEEVASAVYEDLGLAATPGRPRRHALPGC
jgi:CubicO group peptidase (beta-lactamase class C family)